MQWDTWGLRIIKMEKGKQARNPNCGYAGNHPAGVQFRWYYQAEGLRKRFDSSLIAIHVFSAAVDRDVLVGRRLQAVAQELCDGSWTPLLTNLVQNQKLSDKERAMASWAARTHPPAATSGR